MPFMQAIDAGKRNCRKDPFDELAKMETLEFDPAREAMFRKLSEAKSGTKIRHSVRDPYLASCVKIRHAKTLLYAGYFDQCTFSKPDYDCSFLQNLPTIAERREQYKNNSEKPMASVIYNSREILITQRIYEDAKVVAAFYARFHDQISEEELLENYSLVDDALVHKSPSIITRKFWLDQLVTETVMEAYYSCYDFIMRSRTGRDDLKVHELYSYMKDLISTAGEEFIPLNRFNINSNIYRFSDIICTIDKC